MIDDLYLPFAERTPDTQYADVLRAIVAEGERTATRQGVEALTLMQQTTRYPLRNGFPVITERSIKGFWPKAIGELAAFINGATTIEELAAFGCDWWDAWATPEKTRKRGLPDGDLGPGSYGGAFHDFPAPPGRQPMDQFTHLVEQVRELPELRTHFVSPWIPQYQVRGEGKTPGRRSRPATAGCTSGCSTAPCTCTCSSGRPTSRSGCRRT
ncbi:thymidylate synthase [Klenkia terrae]|uniref:thymidylate synthase n=1 Tax=Klenkia terrae TaxID=1052259 RepID=UPI0036075BD8